MNAIVRRVTVVLAWSLMLLIRLYQLVLSPLLGPSCRFAPTCSTYALQALQQYGILRGSWLAVRRISRCHPGNPGGYDPVPGLEFESDCVHEDEHAHQDEQA